MKAEMRKQYATSRLPEHFHYAAVTNTILYSFHLDLVLGKELNPPVRYFWHNYFFMLSLLVYVVELGVVEVVPSLPAGVAGSLVAVFGSTF